MMDDRFEDVVKEAARDYNDPPATPRDLMWARIEAVRAERARRRQQLRILYSPWTRWGIGIAAALAIGIGIGRLTVWSGSGGIGPIAVAPEERGAPAEGLRRFDASLAYRVAATEHLTRAEAFLTAFRSDPRAGESDTGYTRSADELLMSTRLLLDSPAGEDTRMRTLLEDLELVLAQISQITGAGTSGETEFVNDGIERRGLLLRLRTAIPAGPVVGIEGAM